MPVYRSKNDGYLNKYGLSFYKTKDTTTYIQVPTDPDITVSSSSPEWNPVIQSGTVSLGAGATNDINIDFFDTIAKFRIHCTSGNVNIYFNDFTSTPFRVTNGDIIEFVWDKHYVSQVRFEGGSGGGALVYNVYLHRPREYEAWR